MHRVGRIWLAVGAAASVAVALAIAPAGGSAASAAPPVRLFMATLKGRQTTTFTLSHTKNSLCDQSQSGSGHETVTFSSLRATRLQATRYGAKIVTFSTGRPGYDSIVLGVRIERDKHVVSGPLDPRCEGTGGSTTPAPAPDCGTRRDVTDVTVGWLPARRRTGITVSPGLVPSPVGPFRNCQIEGFAWPELLTSSTNRQAIVAAIPAADLFDPGFGKHIVLAHGRFASRIDGTSYTTTLDWAISLTALKH
jgi:hypothetical protein